MENKMKKTPLYLPSELVIQILLKLPVKLLLRFKCVSKSWFSIISDPHFAKSHFEVSTTTHTQRIVLFYNQLSRTPPPVRSIDFETSINHDFNHDSASLNQNFMLHKPFFYYEIKGSCRGFIFMYCSTNLLVWNPSTGFHRQIPLSPFASKLEAYYLPDHLYGFGYDQSRDDYFAVLLSSGPFLDNGSSHLEFFSLRANTWNDIEGPHFYSKAACCTTIGLFFNGAIHWLASRLFKVKVIVAFDLMKMKLFEMPLPYNLHHDSFDYGLWVFGEFLSLWALDFRNHIVEIWVMKEYKVHSSWTKTLVILIDDDIRHFYPIYSSKSGDIIGTNGCNCNLVKYNDKGQLLEYLQTGPNVQEVVMYTESLLSLPGDPKHVCEDDTNKKNEVLKYSPSLFS